jgi:poly(A) polymerase
MHVAIDKLSDVLQCFPHFGRLLTLCSAKNAYLVGGAIRDALIGRPLTDLDLVFPDDPTSLARRFAREIGGHWFWLDKDRRQSRVVPNCKDEGLHYDFALFRAPELENDLLDRDFTINALALPLAGDLSASSLVDPCRGLDDLRLGVLRSVGKESFRNDPLRIVKGVRHATVLALKIETETLQSMQSEVAGLDHVAPERIRQEIWKIFADDQATLGIQLLHDCGAGEQLFGQGFARSLTEVTGCLAVCRVSWQRLVTDEPIVSAWLAQEIEQGLSNETLLLSTFMLSSIENKLPLLLAEKWRLSRKSKANIAAIVALDKVSLQEFAAIARNERAYSLWAAHYRIDPKLLLLALVAGPPNVAPVSLETQTWVPLVARLDGQRLNDLVDGHWLRTELGLKEGPEMTKALQLLRNAEISGQVSNQDEAHRFLVEYYRNKD